MAALLTLGMQDYRFASHLGEAGGALTAVLFPGLLGSMAIAGNAHAFSLWIAAEFNGIRYCSLIWPAWSLASAISRRLRYVGFQASERRLFPYAFCSPTRRMPWSAPPFVASFHLSGTRKL